MNAQIINNMSSVRDAWSEEERRQRKDFAEQCNCSFEHSSCFPNLAIRGRSAKRKPSPWQMHVSCSSLQPLRGVLNISYARARLWIGISGVGLIVVACVAGISLQLPPLFCRRPDLDLSLTSAGSLLR